ncbi:hypothetical protein [Salinimonas lutimaris]|uniref:hypothetical protein n=1 Tax=Salinimonas lutimaris TaxID=914153 RepID=UPI001E29D75A|nr:hypothetical protein [Salinimonas lutimaris]
MMWKKHSLEFIKAYSGAWLLTYLLACTFHTQRVLYGLSEVGVSIPLADRLSTTLFDYWGLLPVYGPAIALALLIAMLIVQLLSHFIGARVILGLIGGATAMAVMLISMQPIMGVTLIAGARETMGVVLQCVAGASGGVLFAWLYQRNAQSESL